MGRTRVAGCDSARRDGSNVARAAARHRTDARRNGCGAASAPASRRRGQPRGLGGDVGRPHRPQRHRPPARACDHCEKRHGGRGPRQSAPARSRSTRPPSFGIAGAFAAQSLAMPGRLLALTGVKSRPALDGVPVAGNLQIALAGGKFDISTSRLGVADAALNGKVSISAIARGRLGRWTVQSRRGGGCPCRLRSADGRPCDQARTAECSVSRCGARAAARFNLALRKRRRQTADRCRTLARARVLKQGEARSVTVRSSDGPFA